MSCDYDSDELYEDTDVASIAKWLEACEDAAEVALHRGGTSFSEWERGFIESIREQYDRRILQESSKPLSGKQLVILRRLYDKT